MDIFRDQEGWGWLNAQMKYIVLKHKKTLAYVLWSDLLTNIYSVPKIYFIILRARDASPFQYTARNPVVTARDTRITPADTDVGGTAETCFSLLTT